jgi:hypothetical protein
MMGSIYGMEYSEQIVSKILYFITCSLFILAGLLLWKVYGEILFINNMILSILC